MLVIPGRRCHTCEGPTRRELLRAGSIGMLGLNLANFLAWQKTAQAANQVRRRARLRQRQIGDHDLPAGRTEPHRHLGSQARRARQHPRRVQSHPDQDSRHAHRRAHADDGQALDKATLIRSMSYTPNGLFNHTAAIYQMLTGYPPDRVSPSGQLEPPSPADFPDRRQPRLEAEAAQGSRCCRSSSCRGRCRNRASSARAARPASSARRTIRTASIRTRPSRSSTDDLTLRKEIPPERLKDRFELLEGHQRIDAGSGEGAEELRHRRILRQGLRPGALRQGARRVRPHQGARQDRASATA